MNNIVTFKISFSNFLQIEGNHFHLTVSMQGYDRDGRGNIKTDDEIVDGDVDLNHVGNLIMWIFTEVTQRPPQDLRQNPPRCDTLVWIQVLHADDGKQKPENVDQSKKHEPIPKQTFLHKIDLLETVRERAAEVLLDSLFDLFSLLKPNDLGEEFRADEDCEYKGRNLMIEGLGSSTPWFHQVQDCQTDHQAEHEVRVDLSRSVVN